MIDEYVKLALAGQLARKGLQKEALVPTLVAASVLPGYVRKSKKEIRRKVHRSRPYYDVETGRFL